MIPRRKTSIKWTALPSELTAQIEEVLCENFAAETKLGKFMVEGRIYPEELVVRIGYLERGRLKQANIEVSLDFNANKQNALETIHFILDCAASFIKEFFDLDHKLDDFPLVWKSFFIDKKEVFMQVSAVNSALESEADRLLGETTDTLVQGELDDLTEDSSEDE